MQALLFLPSGCIPIFPALFILIQNLIAPSPGLSRANFERIKIGMTKGEVEKLLGGPAKANVTETTPTVEIVNTKRIIREKVDKHGIWYARQIAISVTFDSKNVVIDKRLTVPEIPWFLDNIDKLLGR